jgi:hypothetical protein
MNRKKQLRFDDEVEILETGSNQTINVTQQQLAMSNESESRVNEEENHGNLVNDSELDSETGKLKKPSKILKL